MNIQLGPINLPVYIATLIISTSILYILIKILIKNNKNFLLNYLTNVLIISVIVWKISPVLTSFRWGNPLSFIFLPGNRSGIIIAYIIVILYTIYKTLKEKIYLTPFISVLFILSSISGQTIFYSYQNKNISNIDVTELEHIGIEINENPLVINFWATWCAPCKFEIPELNLFYNSNKNSIDFYGVNLIESEKDNINNFIDNYNITFPIVYDYNSLISNYFDISTIPTTLVIIKIEDSYKVKKHYGAITQEQLQIMLDL